MNHDEMTPLGDLIIRTKGGLKSWFSRRKPNHVNWPAILGGMNCLLCEEPLMDSILAHPLRLTVLECQLDDGSTFTDIVHTYCARQQEEKLGSAPF